MVTRATSVRAAADVVYNEVQEEAVLLHTVSGRYYGLDGVGTRFWQLTVEGRSLADVQQRLLDEYDVEPERLWRDLEGLVETLLARGLVEFDGPRQR